MRNYPLVLLACIVVLGGCRTYGGYDSKELNVEALAALSEQVISSADVAEVELALLTDAAQMDGSLASLADVFAATFEHHRALADRLSNEALPSGYRSASRTIGAVVSEMNVIRDGYNDVKTLIAESRGATINRTNTSDDIAYSDVPPYFRRIKLNQDLSMRDVLSINR